MVKAAFGYVTPVCCPVHAVSFHTYRRVAWAATGNTSTSCSCGGTLTVPDVRSRNPPDASGGGVNTGTRRVCRTSSPRSSSQPSPAPLWPRSSVRARPRTEEDRVKHQLFAESNFDEISRRHSGCPCVTGNEADAARELTCMWARTQTWSATTPLECLATSVWRSGLRKCSHRRVHPLGVRCTVLHRRCEEPPQDINMAIPRVAQQCLMLSVVGGTGYCTPCLLWPRVFICGPACVSVAASNSSGCMSRTCGTRLTPGSRAAILTLTPACAACACVPGSFAR